MNQPAKYRQQLARETDAIDASAQRFRDQLKDAPEHSEPGLALLKEFWEPLALTIADEQRSQKSKRRMDGYGIPMLALAADSLAVITLQCVIWAHGSDLGNEEESEEIGEEEVGPQGEDLDGGDTRPRLKSKKMTGLSEEIAKRCEHAWGVMPDTARQSGLDRCIKETSTQKARQKKCAREKLDRDWSKQNFGIPFGAKLVMLAHDAGIVTAEQSDVPGDNRAYVVAFKDGFRIAFEECEQRSLDLLKPLFRPMVWPPDPWGPKLNNGGYLTNRLRLAKCGKHTHLVKHRDDPERIRNLKIGKFAKVLVGVNAMQATPWRINRPVFEIMSFVAEMRRNLDLKNLGKKEQQRVAPLHRRSQFTWTNVLRDKCDICADLIDEEAIYFPYQLDYRGRAYCMPASVHPQADDIGRSLLLFADSKPLGSKGADWLAIHLANARGKDDDGARRLDKASFQDRIDWTHENSEKIRGSARDPLGQRWWMSASKPWRFLAACFEWDGYLSDPTHFCSCLPIAMDGTCNGLQHLSALFLDERGAEETNLSPGHEPRDIYQTVADDIVPVIGKDWDHGDRMADAWRDALVAGGVSKPHEIGEAECMRFDRDVAKAAVMTTPYGVTKGGIKLQLFTLRFTAALHVRGSSPLAPSHLKNPGRFIEKLRTSSDPVSQYIWGRVLPEERQSMTRGDGTEEERRAALAQSLDRIIQGQSIYEAQRFAEVELSKDADQMLAAQEREKLMGTDGTTFSLFESQIEERSTKPSRLNRILLEDAYPQEIVKRQVDRWKACEYFSQKLIVCIGMIVDPKNERMKWFQEVAMLLSQAGRSICWMAPSGFPVFQETWKLEKKKIQAGKGELVLWKKPDAGAVRDVEAQKRKIVANLIHSLDAAHLVLTISRLHSEGLKHFGVVHDCYAVHACDVDALRHALREEFVGMYRIPEGGKSVLQTFLAEQEEVAGELKIQLTVLPLPGNFDIERVLESQYLFC